MVEIIPNWHPAFVHFTIGLLTVSIALFFISAVITKPTLRGEIISVARWNLWLGVLITIGTVVAGFHAFNTVAHGSAEQHAAMLDHRKWALISAGVFSLLALWSASLRLKHEAIAAGQRYVFLIGLAVAGTMLAVTGYKGSELVYHHGIGVKPSQVSEETANQPHSHGHGEIAKGHEGGEDGHAHSPQQEKEAAQANATAQHKAEHTDSEPEQPHEEIVQKAHHAEVEEHAHETEGAVKDIEPNAGNHEKHVSEAQSSESSNHAAVRHKPEQGQRKQSEHRQHKAASTTPAHQEHETAMDGAGQQEHQQHQSTEGNAPDQHQGHEENMGGHKMNGFYGSYPMSREASGTSWVPDASPMEGIHGKYGAWKTMVHGYANLVYDDQGGRRGDEKTFSESMLMAMAMRPLGKGTLGLRGMLSLDPLMGKDGYPLLLQTGETANGVTPLIDRQHPHDLLMELAASYSYPVSDTSSVFGYFGYPGEPALGPPTFMHRFSGMDNPEAPLGHHWLDSTHITFGVATLGYVWRDWKVEASTFKGREPDENRWNFDPLKLDSFSGRFSYNPTEHWSMQVSHGRLESPEQLEPEVDQRRTTASVIYSHPFDQNNWQTTFAWGRNDKNPGTTTDTFLLESALKLADIHTVFGRAEYGEKDELFTAGPLVGQPFDVGKLSLGYIFDFPVAEHVALGVGGLGSVYALPDRLEPAYGENPISVMLFARMKLR